MLYAPDYGPVLAVLSYVGPLVLALVNRGGRPEVVLFPKPYLQVVP